MVVGKRLLLDVLSRGRLPIKVDGVMSSHPWQVPGHFDSFRKLVGAVKFSCGGENTAQKLIAMVVVRELGIQVRSAR